MEFAPEFLRQIVNAGRTEQVAVEIADNCIAIRPEPVGRFGLVHLGPQILQPGMPPLIGLAARFLKETREAVFGQQLDVFGKHAEQHPHQEQRGLLDPQRHFPIGAVLAQAALVLFELFGDPAQPFGNVAGDRHCLLARIDAGRIEPDAAQQIAHLFVAQLRQCDPVGLLIGEKAVAAPVAGPVEIEFERAPDIGNDQKRRRAMAAGQRQHIAFGLNAGVGHQPVIARFALVARGIAGDIAEQIADRLARVFRRVGG